MKPEAIRKTVIALSEKGHSHRKISQLLNVSRNTVRDILAEGAVISPGERKTLWSDSLSLLREVFNRCKGNAVRIQEILRDEYGQSIAYSTLTRLIQTQGLRKPKKRVGEYHFEPGVEMQHDTSPHKVLLGEVLVKAQCASLVLANSRYLFVQYYPCFTRFEAKTFLTTAFEFMQGLCRRCVVDNTSVILAAGSGANAVIAPEMAAFSRMFGFEFMAHRIGHADRKSFVERPFAYAENNFLVGRSFKDWDDLNHQARRWCTEMANQKEKRSLGMSPQTAFIQEKPYLLPLPEVLPPIYEHVQRLVDSKGFINLDSNRYSAPEKLIGKTLDVYKYLTEVHLVHAHQAVGVHKRFAGKCRSVSTLKGHHTGFHYQQSNELLKKAEATLCQFDDKLGVYLTLLKKNSRGDGIRNINRLLHLKRTYPADAFIRAIQQAHHYGLYDLNRLEALIIKCVAGDYFNLTEHSKEEA